MMVSLKKPTKTELTTNSIQIMSIGKTNLALKIKTFLKFE